MRCRSRIRLIAAVLAFLTPLAAFAGGAEVAGSHVIDLPDPQVGGLSGMDLSPDGQKFYLLSDRAVLFAGRFARDDKGVVTGLAIESATPLRGTDGAALAGDRVDAEGLAVTADGRIFASFELAHRVDAYSADGRLMGTLGAPVGMEDYERNSGLEALAVAREGTLYTLAEGATRGWGERPVFRLRNGQWLVAFHIPRVDYFRPVGADFGPDGRLYVLERDFWGLVGFRSRLRRIAFDDGGVTADELLWETRLGDHSNLEGVAIWQDTSGRLRATLVADNNFTAFVRSEIVDLVLPD